MSLLSRSVLRRAPWPLCRQMLGAPRPMASIAELQPRPPGNLAVGSPQGLGSRMGPNSYHGRPFHHRSQPLGAAFYTTSTSASGPGASPDENSRTLSPYNDDGDGHGDGSMSEGFFLSASEEEPEEHMVGLYSHSRSGFDLDMALESDLNSDFDFESELDSDLESDVESDLESDRGSDLESRSDSTLSMGSGGISRPEPGAGPHPKAQSAALDHRNGAGHLPDGRSSSLGPGFRRDAPPLTEAPRLSLPWIAFQCVELARDPEYGMSLGDIAMEFDVPADKLTTLLELHTPYAALFDATASESVVKYRQVLEMAAAEPGITLADLAAVADLSLTRVANLILIHLPGHALLRGDLHGLPAWLTARIRVNNWLADELSGADLFDTLPIGQLFESAGLVERELVGALAALRAQEAAELLLETPVEVRELIVQTAEEAVTAASFGDATNSDPPSILALSVQHNLPVHAVLELLRAEVPGFLMLDTAASSRAPELAEAVRRILVDPLHSRAMLTTLLGCSAFDLDLLLRPVALSRAMFSLMPGVVDRVLTTVQATARDVIASADESTGLVSSPKLDIEQLASHHDIRPHVLWQILTGHSVGIPMPLPWLSLGPEQRQLADLLEMNPDLSVEAAAEKMGIPFRTACSIATAPPLSLPKYSLRLATREQQELLRLAGEIVIPTELSATDKGDVPPVPTPRDLGLRAGLAVSRVMPTLERFGPGTLPNWPALEKALQSSLQAALMELTTNQERLPFWKIAFMHGCSVSYARQMVLSSSQWGTLNAWHRLQHIYKRPPIPEGLKQDVARLLEQEPDLSLAVMAKRLDAPLSLVRRSVRSIRTPPIPPEVLGRVTDLLREKPLSRLEDVVTELDLPIDLARRALRESRAALRATPLDKKLVNEVMALLRADPTVRVSDVANSLDIPLFVARRVVLHVRRTIRASPLPPELINQTMAILQVEPTITPAQVASHLNTSEDLARWLLAEAVRLSTRRRWIINQAQVDRALYLAQKASPPLTYSEIAEQVGISVPRVRTIIRIHLPEHRPARRRGLLDSLSDSQVNQVLALARKTQPVLYLTEIARETGISIRLVQQLLQRDMPDRVPRQMVHTGPELIHQLSQLVNNSSSNSTVLGLSRATGVGRTRLRQILAEHFPGLLRSRQVSRKSEALALAMARRPDPPTLHSISQATGIGKVTLARLLEHHVPEYAAARMAQKPPRRMAPEVIARLRDMAYNTHMPVVQMAEELNLSLGIARAALREHAPDMHQHRRSMKKSMLQPLLQAMDGALPRVAVIKEAAARVGISQQVARRLLAAEGLLMSDRLAPGGDLYDAVLRLVNPGFKEMGLGITKEKADEMKFIAKELNLRVEEVRKVLHAAGLYQDDNGGSDFDSAIDPDTTSIDSTGSATVTTSATRGSSSSSSGSGSGGGSGSSSFGDNTRDSKVVEGAAANGSPSAMHIHGEILSMAREIPTPTVRDMAQRLGMSPARMSSLMREIFPDFQQFRAHQREIREAVAILFCHWPLYSAETGRQAFDEAIEQLAVDNKTDKATVLSALRHDVPLLYYSYFPPSSP